MTAHASERGGEPTGSPILGRSVIAGLVVAHVALSVYLSWNVGIWLDEAFTMETTSRGLGYALQQALWFELQPPLYFLLVTVWRVFDDSYFWGRLFSLACSLGTLATTVGISRRWLPDLHPAWLLACVALNPYLVWASEEMRLYSQTLLLASLLLMLFYDAFMTDEPSTRSQVLYGLVAAASLYTQYYLGFLLVAKAAGLLSARRWPALIRYVAIMAAVGLVFSPMLWVVPEQVVTHTEGGATTSPARALWLIVHNTQEMIFPIYSWLGRRWFVLAAGLAGAAAVAILTGRARLGQREAAVATMFAVAVAMYTGAIFISGPELVTRRHCAGLFAMGNLIPLMLIQLQPSSGRRWVALLYVGLISLVTAYSLREINAPMAKDNDAKNVVAFIEEREEPGQPILVYPREAMLAMEYYYDGPNVMIPLPSPATFERYEPHGAVLHTEEQVSGPLYAIDPDPERIWIVATMLPGEDIYLGVPFNTYILMDFLQRNYRVITSQGFMGAQVIYMRKR